MEGASHVFLLHGLGGRSWSLRPLELYLQYNGYSNAQRIDYPVDVLGLDECLDHVSKELAKCVSKQDPIVLIGQSMGGVVANNMHKRGWNIVFAIYIGSPLHGANLLNQLEAVLPATIKDFFYKKPYGFLKDKEREEKPPHPFHTISMGWFFSDFDGCVYRSEATLDDEHHTHLAWADHRSIFANPRLGMLICSLLK